MEVKFEYNGKEHRIYASETTYETIDIKDLSVKSLKEGILYLEMKYPGLDWEEIELDVPEESQGFSYGYKRKPHFIIPFKRPEKEIKEAVEKERSRIIKEEDEKRERQFKWVSENFKLEDLIKYFKG